MKIENRNMLKYTSVQKVLVHFEVSMAVYVNSCKLRACDPILLNKTTGYFHEIFQMTVFMFRRFSVAPQYSQKINHKIFLG